MLKASKRTVLGSFLIVLLALSNAGAFAAGDLPKLGEEFARWGEIFPNFEKLPWGTLFNNRYVVSAYDGKTWTVEIRYPGERYPTLDDARVGVSPFLPNDSLPINTYSPEGRPEAIVDLFHSQYLEESWPSGPYIGGDVGDLFVLHKVFDEAVHVSIVSLGNRP
ncbi:MAG: hypothetical protein R3C97_15385 [Geminicoccaceae bacterium]